MRDRRLLLFVVVASLLAGCTETESARFGLMVMYVFAIPLLLLQVIVTALGVGARDSGHGVAVFFSVLFSIVGAIVATIGMAIVLDLHRVNRPNVLGELIGLVLCELFMLMMTAHVAVSGPPSVDADVDAALEAGLIRKTKVSPMMWVVGVYLAVAGTSIGYVLTA
ncbi:MAG TPA: hypothetical protein VL400_18770 [Polyangiaceae bacterium]|jgi:hypothetical protein|nr:hypothetical protein [Polyangiaceae bacterium]